MRHAGDPLRQAANAKIATRPDLMRSPRLLWVARWWSRRELRHALDGLQVAGLPPARRLSRERSIVFAATHVAFWDVFVLITLDEALGTEAYALMDAENLCRLPLAGRLGAIPLRRDQARGGLRAAAAMLQTAGRAVWIFPQGDPRPAHLRPLGFRPGVQLLCRLAPQAAVVPVALQYAYAASYRPVAYASFGRPLSAAAVAAKDGLGCLERAAEAELARIDRFLVDRSGAFETVVPSAGRSEGETRVARLLNRAMWARRSEGEGRVKR
jgi:1-acyl-sn-glycerol-3-phosphate acyltransferase